jgi:hypothetical protein
MIPRAVSDAGRCRFCLKADVGMASSSRRPRHPTARGIIRSTDECPGIANSEVRIKQRYGRRRGRGSCGPALG